MVIILVWPLLSAPAYPSSYLELSTAHLGVALAREDLILQLTLIVLMLILSKPIYCSLYHFNNEILKSNSSIFPRSEGYIT